MQIYDVSTVLDMERRTKCSVESYGCCSVYSTDVENSSVICKWALVAMASDCNHRTILFRSVRVGTIHVTSPRTPTLRRPQLHHYLIISINAFIVLSPENMVLSFILIQNRQYVPPRPQPYLDWFSPSSPRLRLCASQISIH